jgi:hypothetical protein
LAGGLREATGAAFASTEGTRESVAALIARIDRSDLGEASAGRGPTGRSVRTGASRQLETETTLSERRDPETESPAWIEGTRAERWDPAVELDDFGPPLVWSYHGREPDSVAQPPFLPIVASLGCAHAAAGSGGACRYGLCPVPREVPFDRVLAQADHWWSQGARAFELLGPDPFAHAESLLGHLARQDRRPERVVLSPSLPALRQHEAMILRLHAAHPATAVEVTGLSFFLAGRPLGFPGVDTSQWEARRIARVLRRIEEGADARLSVLAGHDLRLLDPYSTLEEVLDSLQAVEEDAPFLKASLEVEEPVLPATTGSAVAIQWDADGLAVSGRSLGISFGYRSPEIPLYRDLLARGMAPLLEAVGRLRLPPSERDRLAVEGRFRWFRELARFIVSKRGGKSDPADGWGRVLAGVTGELGLDRARPR